MPSSASRIGPFDTRHITEDPDNMREQDAMRMVRGLATVMVLGVIAIWLSTGAIAAQSTPASIDLHSDQATVPAWVFFSVLIAAIGTTFIVTWKLATVVNGFAGALKELQSERKKRRSNKASGYCTSDEPESD